LLDKHGHAAFVDAWLERSAANLPPERLLALFEQAFVALWRRPHTMLGEVTLGAVAERVLYNAAEKYPVLSSLSVAPTGEVQCAELRERISAVEPAQLLAAVRFVLGEFMSVLGNLTAEILTQELRSELSKISSAAATKPKKGAPAS